MLFRGGGLRPSPPPPPSLNGTKLVVAHYLHGYMLGDFVGEAQTNTPPNNPSNLSNWPPGEFDERTWWPDSLNAICQAGITAQTTDLNLAAAAGLDAFAVLINPTNIQPISAYLPGLTDLAAAAATNSVKLIPDIWFSINNSQPSSPTNPIAPNDWTAFGQNIYNWTQTHPSAFLRVGGKPVISISSALYENNVNEASMISILAPWGGLGSVNLIFNSAPDTIPSDLFASGWASVAEALGCWAAGTGWQGIVDSSGDTSFSYLLADAQFFNTPLDWPVRPSFFAFRAGVATSGACYGAVTHIDNWRGAIANNVSLVTCQTWNDFSEDHALTNTNERGISRILLNKYFSTWFKTGAQPTITSDTLLLFYPRQLLSCTLTEATVLAQTPASWQNQLVDYLHVVSMLTAPGLLTLTCGALNMTLSAPAGIYDWLVYVNLAAIFTSGVAGSDNGWQGYNIVQEIDPSLLTANTSGLIAVQFQTAAGTSGTLDSAWIGEQGSSNAYSFDGNQAQLKFSGSGSRALSGAQTFTSDLTTFSYDSTKALVIAVHFSGTTVNIALNGGLTGAATYYESGADVSSTTSKTGFTRIGTGSKCYFVAEVLALGPSLKTPVSNSYRHVDVVTTIPASTPLVALTRGGSPLVAATGPIAIASTAKWQDLTTLGAVSSVYLTGLVTSKSTTRASITASGLNVPTVSAISDNGSGLANGSTAGNRPVTITGTNFISGATVTIGGVAAINVVVVNPTTITCRTQPKSAGVASVVVTTSHGSNSPNSLYTYTLGGLTPPSFASAAGFNTLSFQDEFTDLLGIDTANSLTNGFNFYTQTFGFTHSVFSGGFQDWGIAIQYMTSAAYPPYSFTSNTISVTGSVLTLTGNTNRWPSGEIQSTAFVNNAAGYVGTTVNSANGFYIEAKIAGESDGGGASNAWWFVDNRALTGANTTAYMEFDIPELVGGTACNFNIIPWTPPSNPGARPASGNPGSFVLDNNFHVYGTLYVPPAGATNGFVKFYVDDLTTPRVTVTVAPGSALANQLATAQNHMILQTDANTSTNPFQIDYVRVWQGTANG